MNGCLLRESKPQGKPMGLRGWEDEESERRSVIERIEVELTGNITSRESGLTFIWSLITRELE